MEILAHISIYRAAASSTAGLITSTILKVFLDYGRFRLYLLVIWLLMLSPYVWYCWNRHLLTHAHTAFSKLIAAFDYVTFRHYLYTIAYFHFNIEISHFEQADCSSMLHFAISLLFTSPAISIYCARLLLQDWFSSIASPACSPPLVDTIWLLMAPQQNILLFIFRRPLARISPPLILSVDTDWFQWYSSTFWFQIPSSHWLLIPGAFYRRGIFSVLSFHHIAVKSIYLWWTALFHVPPLPPLIFTRYFI